MVSAKRNRRNISLFLFSRTVAEDGKTVTDCGYFAEFLPPEVSKDGRLAFAVYRETTTYNRRLDGESNQVRRVRTEVLVSHTI